MKYVTYIEDHNDIDKFKELDITDVIIAIRDLSRLGKLSFEEGIELAHKCLKCGLRPILEWDILMCESEFQKSSEIAAEFVNSSKIKVIRAYDVGAINFSRSLDVKIQPILEHGNHNLKSIDGWGKILGEQLDRIVLSYELDSDALEKYISKLPYEFELYLLGQITLSYTPRKLLQNSFEKDENGEILVVANSKECNHKNFKVLENQHGTFPFYAKDHSLVAQVEELDRFGLSYGRVDLRHIASSDLLEKIIKEQNIDSYPNPTSCGFYKSNKTDVLFSKLKNKKIERTDEGFIGGIIDVAKKKYMAIQKKSSLDFSVGDSIKIFTPEGKEKNIKLTTLWNSNNERIESSEGISIVYLPHHSGISVRSSVYLANCLS